MCARKRQRKKFHKLKRLSVFVSMATGHTTAHLCIVITHYPQSHRLFLPCLFLSSIAKAKGGKKRGRSASCNYNFSFWGRRLTAVSPSSLTPPLHACTLARNNEPYIHRPTRWALINCHRYRRYIYNPKLWLHSKSARVKLEEAKCFCLPVWHYECCHFLSLTAVWSCCMLSDVPSRISMWAFFVLFLCFFPVKLKSG